MATFVIIADRTGPARLLSSFIVPACIWGLLLSASLANATSFTHWATVTPHSDWRLASGDVTGDGQTDVIGFHPSNGSIHVGTNSADADDRRPCNREGRCFDFRSWGELPGGRNSNVTIVVGDFRGTQLPDVLAYNHDSGVLHIGVNSDRCGSDSSRCFAFDEVRPRLTGEDRQLLAADFRPGDKTDIVAYTPSNGKLHVGTFTEQGFSFTEWARVTPQSRWQFVAADIDADGKADVVGYHPSNGTVRVGINTQSCENDRPCFRFSEWATVPESHDAGWQFIASRPGGQTPDLVAYNPRSGNLFILENRRSAFLVVGPWATVPEGHRAGWRFFSGDFLGAGGNDLMAYNPHNGYLRVGNSRAPFEGYAWPLSGRPGQEIDFYVSGSGSPLVECFRHKANGNGLEAIRKNRTAQFSPRVQFTNAQAWREGAGWNKSFTLSIPDEWESGIYSARVTTAGGHSHVPFIVKPAPERRSRLAVIVNVNTWLAYNRWGGKGKYSGAAEVSFLRPNPAASPVAEDPTMGTHPHHLTRGELWILGWLEEASQRFSRLAEFRPDVYPDSDFHDGDGLPPSYKTLVLSTHPEYWSVGMYDNLKRFFDRGGSLLYLGGNGIYERGTYKDQMTRMILREGEEGGSRAPALFRMLGEDPPRLERELLGVATERCDVPGAGYEVLMPAHSFFRGTTLERGSIIGENGLNTAGGQFNGAAAAWEVDTSDGFGATSIPYGCATCSNDDTPGDWSTCVNRWILPAGPGQRPSGLQILARAQNWRNQRGDWQGAEMIYYPRNGGGFIFSVGSITFGGSLVVDAQLQQIVRNVLTEAASR